MRADVIVVGAGATGCGIAWDLSLRGVRVLLVDRGGLGAGTTGRYHGLLHSGARYVVTDPATAAECARENLIVRKIASPALNETGGLFVLGARDDPSYVEQWEQACGAAGVAIREISVHDALAREPGLDRGIRGAFEVSDAVCNAFSLCSLLARAAEARGATILTHHDTAEFIRENGSVVGVCTRDSRSGATTELRARLTILAAGPWNEVLARRAGASLTLSLARGAMLAYEGLLVRGSVNRLQPPDDGDILLPRGNVSIAGTTIVPTDDPDDRSVSADEIQRIQDQISEIIPGVRDTPMKHSWSGVRPIYEEGSDTDTRGDPHHWSRDFSVVDHAAKDGIEGLVTIVGGKLTTFRLMAERTTDLACRILGIEEPCATSTTAIR